MDAKQNSELLETAGIHYLNDNNCEFVKCGDFVGVNLKDDDDTHYSRVSFNRLFPYDMPYQYISVHNMDGDELGIIADVCDFDNDTAAIIKDELKRKYYICSLSDILVVKDRFGFSYWKALSDGEEISFTIRDAHNSIRTNSEGKILLSDIDGNRYVLPPFNALSKKTQKRIELYL